MDPGAQPHPIKSQTIPSLGFFPACVVFFFVFLLPVAALFITGLSGNKVSASLSGEYFSRIIVFTYGQALLSTLLSLLLGGGAAFLLFETSSAWPPKLSRLSLLCFSCPSLLVVLAILGVWGRSGLWNRLVGTKSFFAVDVYGIPGIVLANAFFNFPLFLLCLGLGLRGLDRRLEFSSLAYGASRLRTFFSLTLPRLWPALRTALVLSFLYSSMTSFVVALFLGGGPRATTLEVAIYQALKMDSNIGLAVRLSLVSLAISSALYFILRKFEWRGASQDHLSAAVAPLYFVRHPISRIVLYVVFAALFFGVVLAPLFVLVSEGVNSLGQLPVGDAMTSVLASLSLALLVVAITLPMATFFAFAEKQWGESRFGALWTFLPALPLAVSSLVLSVALLTFYPETMASLRGYLWPVALVQAFSSLPLASRVIRDALFKIPDPLYVSARSFGASPLKLFWLVERPLLGPAFLTAGLLTVGISMGEVASLLLFSPGEISTLSVEIFRSVQRYRFAEGAAYGVLLLTLLSAVVGSSTLVRSTKWD